MEKLAAFIYRALEPLLMRQYLVGQRLVRYHEVKTMFGGGNYPPETFRIFDGLSQMTTRAGILARLRDIQFRAMRDAHFSQSAMFEERLGRKIFG